LFDIGIRIDKTLSTELPTNSQNELAPLNRIRVETTLSRYPIHRLAKKGTINIDLQGDADVKWEVTYNSKHGQPGPLAYKLDTLIVNRRLDELGRPLPEIVKIGSLSEICRSLGSHTNGSNISDVKRAFLQNAFAAITAKVRGKTKTGREKWFEIGYTRYSVVFTGEALPDGTEADAVYIVLNPPYRDLLNHVELRPLDYDYLKHLAPGPQRLYELLSFQIYGALAGGRPRAKMLYSDYCKYAPQTRYPDFEHMKKQMYKVHLPHRESGYITKVEYEETIDAEGNANWEMFYTPGPRAFAEYQAFTNRQLPQFQRTLPNRGKGQGTPVQSSFDLAIADPNLLAEMTRRGIAEKRARELLSHVKPGQEVMDQLEYVDSLVARDRHRKLDNPPGLYVHYVRDNIAPPADFLSSRKARLQEQARQAEHAERARQAQQEIEYDEYQAAEIQRYISEAMPQEEYLRIFAQHQQENRRLFKQIPAAQLDELTARSIADELKQSGRVPLLSFEEFCRKRSQSQSE
jgi:hypothetical protein